MAELHELIEKIENPELRAQLQAAADKLTNEPFSLGLQSGQPWPKRSCV